MPETMLAPIERWSEEASMSLSAYYAQPNSTPWGQVNVPDDEVLLGRAVPLGLVVSNPKVKDEPAVTYYEGGDIGLLTKQIGVMANASSDESSIMKIADAIEKQIGIIKQKQSAGILGATKSGKGLRGDPWVREGMKTVNWIRGGVMNRPPDSPIFVLGNIKLPYWQFSTLAGITCVGAGACMNKQGDITNQKWLGNKGGMGWCYSFSAWRQPAPFFRHLNNTIMMRLPDKKHILKALDAVTAYEKKKNKTNQYVLRLYVDGDMHDESAIDFWMRTLRARPNISAYGYSKSWPQFLSYDKKINGNWPDNYALNLSGGSKFDNIPALRDRMMQLKCTRGEFLAVKMSKKYPPTNINTNLLTPDQISVLKQPVGKDGVAKVPMDISEYAFVPNKDYEAEVRRQAMIQFPRIGGKMFVCPSKCGTCLMNRSTIRLKGIATKVKKVRGESVEVQEPVFEGVGKNQHACGLRHMKTPIVIGIH